jgi:hypothetical protein
MSLSIAVAWLIGLILLFSGIGKAFFTGAFIDHVQRYDLFSSRLTAVLAVVFIQLECAAGTALILYAYPQVVLPGVFILIGCLSGLTLWGWRQRGIESCGCYGAMLPLKPLHSVGLNAGYLLLLGMAWYTIAPAVETPSWKGWAVIAVLIAANLLGKRTLRYPLFDPSPLKAGRRWQDAWVSWERQSGDGSRWLVFFLKPQCPKCRQWLDLLGVMQWYPGQPRPVLVFPDSKEALPRLPVGLSQYAKQLVLSRGRYRHLVYYVPLAVLVERDVIVQKWVGEFPLEYL